MTPDGSTNGSRAIEIVSGTNWCPNGQGTRTGHGRGGQDARKMDVRDLVTFALMKVRLSVVHRPNIGERVTVDRGKRKELGWAATVGRGL